MNVELVIGNVKLFALRAMLNFSITNYICRRHSIFNIQYSIARLRRALQFCLSLNILFQEQVFTIENSISELPYPVTENHHASIL